MTPLSSRAIGVAINRTLFMFLIVLPITLVLLTDAKADNIYTFETLSATLDGVPAAGLTAYGEIVVSASAVADGYAALTTSNPEIGTPSENFDGVISAYFGFLIGPQITSPDGVINFTANLSGDDIQINPINSYGGFFVNGDDTDAYYAVSSSGSDILTIGYGTNDASSPCYGLPLPGEAKCVVTGEFVDADDPVPEPGSLVIFVGSLGLLGGLLCRRMAPAGAAVDARTD